jgi:chemotaxis signal transduction protein
MRAASLHPVRRVRGIAAVAIVLVSLTALSPHAQRTTPAPTQRLTRLPGAPDTVCGLINLRGTIVTVLDGGVTLGKPPCSRNNGLTLLVDYFERLVGVGVDDVRDIHDVPIDQFADAPGDETIGAGVVTGIVEIEGRRVSVLDIKALVQQVIGQGR